MKKQESLAVCKRLVKTGEDGDNRLITMRHKMPNCFKYEPKISRMAQEIDHQGNTVGTAVTSYI